MVIVQSKRRKPENILKEYPNAIIADVTSHAKDGLVKLSPLYRVSLLSAWRNIYVVIIMCVEAVWQGLKVFETADVDVEMFSNGTMKDLKRTVRKWMARNRLGVEIMG